MELACGVGVGRAAARTLIRWLADRMDCEVLRLSNHPDNTAAKRLYASLGFRPLPTVEDDEVVAELSAKAVAATAAD